MLKRILLIISLMFITFSVISSSTEAIKLLPQLKKGTSSTIRRGYGSGPAVSARLRQDRKALNINFSGLSAVSSISYILSYRTEGRDEGVAGTIDSSSGSNISRELLFGTCSSGVCRYHTGITNARLEVTFNLNSGKKIIRRFKIRV